MFTAANASIIIQDGTNPPITLHNGDVGSFTPGNVVSFSLANTFGVERADFQFISPSYPGTLSFSWTQGEDNLWQVHFPSTLVTVAAPNEQATVLSVTVSDGAAQVGTANFYVVSSPLGPFTSNQVGTSTIAPNLVSYVVNSGTGLATMTLSGAGTGVVQASLGSNQEVHDQYQYVNTPVSGDFEFVARLAVGSLIALSQGGVALRESYAANARCVTLNFSPLSINDIHDTQPRDSVQQFCRFNVGLAPGQTSNPSTFAVVPNPVVGTYVWFKITRIGRDVGAYWARDGVIWMPMALSGPPWYPPTGVPAAGFVGFFAASQSQTSTVTAVFDQIYLGAIRTQYETSWIGNSFSQRSKGNQSTTQQFGNSVGNDGYVSQFAQAMWVDPPTGTVYTNSYRDEGSQAAKIYKDGIVVRQFQPSFFGSNSVNDGSITGDGVNVYLGAWGGGATPPGVYTADKTTGQGGLQFTLTNTLSNGSPTGMACSPIVPELYVADNGNNRILVINLTTGLEIPGRAFTFTQGNPGPITCDLRGNLWILSMPVASPMQHLYTATRASGIYQYTAAGAYTGRSITTGLSADASGSFTFPTNVDISPLADEIWVCDNGVDQNIKIFTGLTGTPTLARTFGVTKGIYSGATPGLLNDPAAGNWLRFYSLTAVRRDAAGNVYVACDGAGADIRKFDAAGNLIWNLISDGNEAFGNPTFDQSTNVADAYARLHHYKLNQATTIPGSEWSPYAFTYNPFGTWAANDLRVLNAVSMNVRTISGQTFIYMAHAVYDAQGISVYRKSGETLIPCARFTSTNGGPPGTTTLWVDANANGIVDGGETTTHASPNGNNGALTFMIWDVDTNGDIWWGFQNVMLHFICTGIVSGVPQYSFTGGNYEEILNPTPFVSTHSGTGQVRFIKYDRPNDVLYLGGDTDYLISGDTANYSGGPGAVIARYDGWYANRLVSNTNYKAPEPRYAAPLPRTVDGDGYWYQQKLFYFSAGELQPTFKAASQVGRYWFLSEEGAHIRVWDALLGNWCYSIAPGAELNSEIAFTDLLIFPSAQTSNGQYHLAIENSGVRGSEVYYRWTPNRLPAAAPATPTATSAVGDNGKVRVQWTDWGRNFVDSYNVYRGAGGSALSRIATNVQATRYVDVGAPVGPQLAYAVTAVNVAGESAQSTQSTTHSLSGSAVFVASDRTTKGTWKGVYGNFANYVFGSALNAPASVIITPGQAILNQIIAPGSMNPLALQTPGGSTTRQLFYWTNLTPAPGFAPTLFTFDLWLEDGTTRQLALYGAASAAGQSTTFALADGVTGTVFDTRTMSAYDTTGEWLIWTVSGHLSITVSPGGGFTQAFSGIFLS